MDYRRQDTRRAHSRTCGWITSHPSYTNWLDEGFGILWIKGKPGSGKSTLMEFLLRDFETRDAYRSSIQLSFFLHGRGTLLQKNRLGMYRSLLHQLLLKAPVAQAKFRHAFQERTSSQGVAGQDWNWHTNELRAFFMSAVELIAETQPVNIFVDALDEASDSTDNRHASVQIVSDFHELNDRLHRKQLRSAICFSCRHFPVVADNKGRDIWVERENQADISTYVCDELQRRLTLHTVEQGYLAGFQDIIIRGAQGVFQWAALVVSLAVQYHNDGLSPREISQILAEVPAELGDVYKHILSDVIDKRHRQHTLRLMRWVCLAERPLTITEMCFAMSLPTTEMDSPELSVAELDLPLEPMMIRRVVSLSGGLVELKQHAGRKILQFIHQSVNDFLARDGLRFLDQNAFEDVIGQGHHQLSLICANYMRMTEVNSYKLDVGLAATQLPFVDYAVKSWFLHAEKAETRGISQDYLLRYYHRFPVVLEPWIRLYRLLDESNYSGRRPEESSTMLHIASSANLITVIKGLLLSGLDLEQKDSSGNRAVHYASRWGHAVVVQALLDAGALFEARNNSGCTALERAASNGHEKTVRLLLLKGADVNKQTGSTGNALYGAAAKGNRAIVQLLLKNNADVNAQGGEYGNALQAASFRGYQTVVDVLLAQGADVNAQGGEYGNALQAASYGGHQTVVEVLLAQGADVNAQGGEYGNALQAASYGGHQTVVDVLLAQGAGVNAQGGYFGNALQAASVEGHQTVVDVLLAKGADVNAQGGLYGNALQAASYGGHQTVVNVLLAQGADINAQGGHFGNALQAASYGGHQTVVDVLLAKGADVNAQGGHFGNALQAASYGGQQTVVDVLLAKGADVNAQGGYLGNALQAASYGGHQTVVDVLLAKGADVNAQGGYFGNALQAASFRGHQTVVDVLLAQGADANAQGGYFGNALQAASVEGHQTVVDVLLAKGADVNAQGGEYGNALQAASFKGHQSTMHLLLNKHADITRQDN
ncbi:ankyrin repeat-containing domain protein [Leptodontidium sp. MPI-SDFR-AT-0119]|nr:ankyrin repeat-containing domain protein [Leptodontidium sp. MPI-SDFR-AT-0119]